MSDSEPIGVVQIIARLNIGGPAVIVSLLTQRLGPPEFRSLLVAGRVPPGEGDMAYYATDRGVKPLRLETMSREIAPLADWRTFRELLAILRRERPQVVHTHTAKAGLLGRVAAWWTGVPVIVHTFHGHVLSGYFAPWKTRLFVGLERFCARRSSVLLAVSQQVKDDLVAHGIAPAAQIRVMPLGLELTRFAEVPRGGGALRAELGLGPETPLLGYCGRLTAIKHVDLLLAAFAQLHAQQPEVRLAVLGDGELRAELEQQCAALGVSEAVHFLGFRQDLPPLIADLDAMVLTSTNEGTPVAVIEAAAGGVPSVCTAVGGVPDVVEDGATGWLVPADDVEALTAALVTCLSDPAERERRGREAQRRALERFSVDRLVADIAALYRELLAARR